MSFGVSTHDARLDGGRLGALEPEEIDWTAYLGWTGNKSPAFAGRTFLGRPYLYAHGEGSEANKTLAALARIAPLQRADKDRQEAFGEDGFELGREDGGAFADHVRNCILVGDLSLSSDLVYAFLEVEAGTKISPEYWTGWSTTIYNAIVADLRGGGLKLAQPLLPCICCAFKDDGAGSFVASQDVVDCLDAAGEKLAAYQTRCFGFWAVAPDVAANHVVEPNLAWSQLKPHSQTQGSSKQPVWIHLWRYMDEQEAGIPEVGKFALDATFVQSGVDGVLNRMLTVNAWAASARPQRLGVDKGRDVSAEIACLAKTKATINSLPEGSAIAGAGPAINPPLTQKITFAVRYYSTPRTQANKRAKDVSEAEARVISRAGPEVAAVWQAAVDFNQIPNYLTTAGNGIEDARNAFAYAKRIGQPPYTPVYFAVDGNFPDAVDVELYFVEVAAGYDQYLLDQDLAGAKRVPYYIGAYASSNILERLYAKGLASHFWQTWPPTWGGFPPPPPPPPPGVRPNERPFLHANMWQVCMEGTAGLLASGIMGCWHASWILGIATTVAGGNLSLTIDGVPTVPAALNFDVTRQQIEQAIAQVAGIGAAGIRTDEWIEGGSRKIRLQFSKNVTVAAMHLLVGPAPPPPLLTLKAEFVDLNVAWGDVGGWQLR